MCCLTAASVHQAREDIAGGSNGTVCAIADEQAAGLILAIGNAPKVSQREDTASRWRCLARQLKHELRHVQPRRWLPIVTR